MTRINTGTRFRTVGTLCAALLVALTLIVSVFAPGTAAADSEAVAWEQVVPGKTIQVTDSYYGSFTPAESGSYHFYSTGSLDTVGGVTIADAQYYTARDDDSGTDRNFDLYVGLNANVEYVFYSFLYDDSGTGSYTICVERVAEVQDMGQLTPGQTVDLNAANAGTVFRYTFTPAVSGDYTLYTTGEEDTYVCLYTDRTAAPAAVQDDYDYDSEDYNCCLTASLTAGTAYTYEVRLNNDSVTGSFALTFVQGDRAASASPAATPSPSAALTVGQPVILTFSNSDELQTLTFTPAVSGSYTIASTSEGSGDPRVYLYEDGSQTLIGSGDDEGDGYNFMLTADLQAGVTYRYEISTWPYASAGTFIVTLSSSAEQPSIIPTPAPVGNAGALSPGETATVAITTGGEQAEYTFTPAVSGWYALEADSDQDTLAYLYAGSGSAYIARDDDSGNSLNFRLLYPMEAGTAYRYQVGFYSSERTGTFQVTLSLIEVRQLVMGENAVSITRAGERIFYAFTPEVSGTYTIESTGSVDARTYLYENGNSESIASDDDSGANMNFRLTSSLVAGTEYFYEISAYRDNTGSFTMTLTSDAAQPAGADAPEHSDSSVLTVGQPVILTFNNSNELQTLTFTPTVSGSYTITSSSEGSVDPRVYLYEDSSQTLIGSSDDEGDGVNFMLTTDLQAGVAYRYEISTWPYASAGTFTVILTSSVEQPPVIPTPAPVPTGEAGALSLGETTVAITTGGGQAEYTLTPAISGWYELESSCDRDTLAYLYAGDSSVYIARDDDSGNNLNFRLLYRLEAGTTYRYQCGYFSNTLTGTFPVTLSRIEGHQLTVGETVQENIAAAGDRVFCVFTPQVSGVYTLESAGSVDVRVSLYASGNSGVVDSDDDSGASMNFRLSETLEAGTEYCYEISTYGSSAGPFTVTLTSDTQQSGSNTDDPTRAAVPAADIVVAGNYTGELTVGQPVNVTFTTADDQVFFRFTPETDGSYTLTSGGSCDPVAKLYDAETETVLATADDDGANYNFSLTCDLTGGREYIYSVWLYDENGSPVGIGSFTLLLTQESGQAASPTVPAADVVVAGEYTGELTVGQPVNVTFTTADDQMFLRFIPETDGSYTLTSSGNCDPVAKLFDAETETVLAAADDDGTGYNFSLTCDLTGGHEYIYTVWLYDENGAPVGIGSFTLLLTQEGGQAAPPIVTAAPVIDLPPDDPGAAQGGELSLDEDTVAVISYGGESLTYYFTPANSGTYVLTSVGSADTRAYLYEGENGTSIASDDDSGEGYNFRLSAQLTGGVTYRYVVRLYSSSLTASFTLRLTCESVTEVKATGNSLPLDQDVSVSITHGGQTAVYYFTPVTAGIYTLTSSGDQDTYATLYAGDSATPLTANDDGGTDNNFSVTRQMNTGVTYRYEVRLYGNSATGSFTIRLTQESETVNGSELTLNEARTVEIASAGSAVRFSFTPTVTGTYQLTASGNDDTYCSLYQEGGAQPIAYDDDSGPDHNFSLVYSLEAGVTYYYEVRYFFTSTTGSFSVILTEAAQ